MSIDNPNFEDILGCSFSPQELKRLEDQSEDLSAITDPYAVEPMIPGRQVLLGMLMDVLEAHTTLRVSREVEALSGEFASMVLPALDIAPGEEVLVTEVRSYEGAEGLMLLDEGQKIFGQFGAMIVDDWYDIPFHEDPEEINPASYLKEYGLFVISQAGILECADGSRMPVGDVAIPLNHGEPELYKVLRQQ